MPIYRRGNVWYVDFSQNNKRIRKKIGPNKKQAELVLQKINVQQIENQYFDIKRDKKVLFLDFSKDYMERHSKINKKSWSRDITSLNKLSLVFGDKYLSQITPEMGEEYKALRMRDGKSNATINRELALIKNMFTKAEEWGIVNKNPLKKVKLLKENNKRVRFLEPWEIEPLFLNCEKVIRPVVAIAMNTGMRLSELLNLTWADLDFIRNLIRVKDSKNNQQRFIPMNAFVFTLLSSLSNGRTSCDQRVFLNTTGGHWHPNTISHKFAKAVKMGNLYNLHFHDLRHHFASSLRMKGVDILIIKELLGHKTLDMTLRYAHLGPNFHKSAIEKLDELKSLPSEVSPIQG